MEWEVRFKVSAAARRPDGPNEFSARRALPAMGRLDLRLLLDLHYRQCTTSSKINYWLCGPHKDSDQISTVFENILSSRSSSKHDRSQPQSH